MSVTHPPDTVGADRPAAYNLCTMAEPTPQEIHADIAAGLPCEHLEVDGDGRHFFATVVSPAFEGLTRVKRHQRVYAALGDKMREHIHALSMKTLTPSEWVSTPAAVSPSAHHHH